MALVASGARHVNGFAVRDRFTLRVNSLNALREPLIQKLLGVFASTVLGERGPFDEFFRRGVLRHLHLIETNEPLFGCEFPLSASVEADLSQHSCFERREHNQCFANIKWRRERLLDRNAVPGDDHVDAGGRARYPRCFLRADFCKSYNDVGVTSRVGRYLLCSFSRIYQSKTWRRRRNGFSEADES